MQSLPFVAEVSDARLLRNRTVSVNSSHQNKWFAAFICEQADVAMTVGADFDLDIAIGAVRQRDFIVPLLVQRIGSL